MASTILANRDGLQVVFITNADEDEILVNL